MAVTQNDQPTYKCRHGKVFATAALAARCDVKAALGDLVEKDRTTFYSHDNPLGLVGECMILLHWISNHPDKLEALIRDFLDASAVGVKMPRPVPAEKKAGEA